MTDKANRRADRLLAQYGEPVSAYKGEGSLLLKDGAMLPITFHCIHLHDAQIIIHLTFFESAYSSRFGDKLSTKEVENEGRNISSIFGTLDDGKRIFNNVGRIILKMGERPKPDRALGVLGVNQYDFLLFLESFEISHKVQTAPKPTRMRFHLINFMFSEHTSFDHGLPVISLDLKGKTLTIAAKDSYPQDDENFWYFQECRVSSYLEMDIENETHQERISLADNLCDLLSLAKGTRIIWTYYEELSEDENLVSAHHRNFYTSKFSHFVALQEHKSDDLTDFLIRVYDNYVKLNEKYDLSSIIKTVNESKAFVTFGEPSALITVTAVDILRARWAEDEDNDREYIFDKEFFEEGCKSIRKTIKDILVKTLSATDKQRKEVYAKLGELNRPPFQVVLEELINLVGAKISKEEIASFIQTRNSLVHLGKLTEPIGSPKRMDEVRKLHHFADRLLLAFIGYINS